jgi:pimeloyl-ACP methyl ester carboxylesterase
MSRRETPRLDELQAALDEGNVDGARRALLGLSEHERELLAEEMGWEALERARAAAARGRRRGKLGKVIVLPGIMGSDLDSVDRSGGKDRIWLNFARLILGRIGDLELAADGSPAKPGLNVRTAGVHRKTYVPLLMELDTRWHVQPFPFDWREDIDRSTDRLAREIEAFGRGDPVHLVAHSMGGLVSRRLIQRHRDTWQSMDDPDGRGRGGRLVMLGTPNRGSFAIPLTLSGSEKLMQLLEKADLRHNLQELLSIIGSFPGLYQMLPSPLVDLDDDHAKLFEAKTWGQLPVRAPLLQLGQSFVNELDEVIDPQRLLYIAGYNQETPTQIRADAAGRFVYRRTFDGDGRVPHALGLLEGVSTYWVDEIHGNLAKNAEVLDAMTELLQQGRTTRLAAAKPPVPPARRAVRRAWVSGEELAPVPPIAVSMVGTARRRGRAGAPELTPEEAARLENLVLAEYLGSPKPEEAEPPVAEQRRATAPDEPKPLEVSIDVVWGELTRVDGDVYAVGHYLGVLPQRAELALDKVVSGIEPGEDYDRRQLVITQHTRRGILRGALGDVSFFPWGNPKLVAIAGMGRPGTFDVTALRRLVSGLIVAVSALPRAETICTVLIGSGDGTLTIPEAVRGLVDGIAGAADEIGASSELVFATPVRRLVIVELGRGRAEDIHDALRDEIARRDERRRSGTDQAPPIELRLSPRVTAGQGRDVSLEEGLALLVDSAVQAAGAASEPGEGQALETLVEGIAANKAVRKRVLGRLSAESEAPTTSRGPRFEVGRRGAGRPAFQIPVRISFWDDGQAIRAAAIHQAATVSERLITVDRELIDELVERMTDPPAGAVRDLSELLHHLLVPAEFRDVLASGPFVFEVDRAMARVHWEMLAGDLAGGGSPQPLSVDKALARQIRTTYSPPPSPPQRPREQLRALVIGDPGDPDQDDDLPGARSEALAVVKLLRDRGVEVEPRIGAPGVPREGRLKDVKPADRLDVLALLLRGGFDLVHYAGHGDFDPQQPNRVGWLFASGLLTPGEIGRVGQVPAIVVSNACLSARTSQALEGRRGSDEARSEAGLLPSLADEFFRLGVRNYVGTAWEVNDVGAELFATTFYDELLPEGGGRGASFGDAVKRARETLWMRRDDYGALWAAYQHYGDPTSEARIMTTDSDGAQREGT